MPAKPIAVIADDSKIERDQLEEALTFAGFRVAAAVADGLAAVRACRIYRPDLVTLDIIMPELSGRDAAEQIHQNLPDAKIIMVTSMGQEGVLAQLRELGFGVLIKPFFRDKVLEAVERVYA